MSPGQNGVQRQNSVVTLTEVALEDELIWLHCMVCANSRLEFHHNTETTAAPQIPSSHSTTDADMSQIN